MKEEKREHQKESRGTEKILHSYHLVRGRKRGKNKKALACRRSQRAPRQEKKRKKKVKFLEPEVIRFTTTKETKGGGRRGKERKGMSRYSHNISFARRKKRRNAVEACRQNLAGAASAWCIEKKEKKRSATEPHRKRTKEEEKETDPANIPAPSTPARGREEGKKGRREEVLQRPVLSRRRIRSPADNQEGGGKKKKKGKTSGHHWLNYPSAFRRSPPDGERKREGIV